jgi:hypothetical protein
MTHEQAKKSLAEGVPPELVCATCPWDRFCIEPPSLSSAEIDRRLEQSKAQDEASAKKNPNAMPTASLLTILAYSGRDTAGRLCPVFMLRLRGPDGRRVADAIRAQMQGWSEADR